MNNTNTNNKNTTTTTPTNNNITSTTNKFDDFLTSMYMMWGIHSPHVVNGLVMSLLVDLVFSPNLHQFKNVNIAFWLQMTTCLSFVVLKAKCPSKHCMFKVIRWERFQLGEVNW